MATIGLILLAGSPVRAFELMQIEQVIGGINGDTTAQAIQLRMRSFVPQNQLQNTRIRVRDAAGLNAIVLVDFTAPVPNFGEGVRVLIASAAFANQSLPPATPDFTLANLIPPSYLAAGSMTYERNDGLRIYWRLSWGGAGFTGPATGASDNDADGNFNPPYPGPLPSDCERALQFQGLATDPSTTNENDYALTFGPAVFVDNVGNSVTLESFPGLCCADDECDDADVCTDGDTCEIGVCVAGPLLVCDDQNLCTDDSCGPVLGCAFTNNVELCDDGDACTLDDACLNGACTGGGALPCEDSNPCTDNTCDPGTGCVFIDNTLPCDDGDPCSIDDACLNGQCLGGPPLPCDDGVDCTDDTCTDGACVWTPNDSLCPDDGSFCTGVEFCGPLLGCVSTGNPCDAAQQCDDAAGNCGPQELVAALDVLQIGNGPVPGQPPFGCATFQVDPSNNTVDYQIVFGGLTGIEIGAEIRGPAAPGIVAAAKHTLPLGNPKTGTWNYDEADETDILNGTMYVTIQSTDSPDGEIRGQMVDLVAHLDGTQAATSSDVKGVGSFMINTTANVVEFHIAYEPFASNETNAKIHGPASHLLPAAPVFTLPSGNPKTGMWQYVDSQELDILNGLMYVNIASDDFPSGEIRGQITPAVVRIDGTQQSAPTGSVAAACAMMSIDEELSLLGFHLQTADLEGMETAAHVHGFAPPGKDIGELFVLPPGDPKLAVWSFDAGRLGDVRAGLTYFDIHSETYPGGEIRGQITFPQATLVEQCIKGTVEECCDVNPVDGARDDNCQWCECLGPPDGTCDRFPIVFGDMGGAFGVCLFDGFSNIHDRNHALTCFSGTNQCDSLNVDAGGAFGACVSDGFCNIHDANHALTAFAGTNTCTCPPSPSPSVGPRVVGETTLRAVAERNVVARGDIVTVRVFVERAMFELQSYQLHLGVSGGRGGRLELIDIAIEDRGDFVFDGSASVFDANNVERGQMLAGLDGDYAVVLPDAYLATFTYRVSTDALGTFVIDVAHDEDNGDQTFLIGARIDDKIEVAAATPIVVTVVDSSDIRSAK